MSYKIGSFNLRNLNYSTRDIESSFDDKHIKRNYHDIGRIICENFDIVALQEVLNENVLSLLFQGYSGWEYRWSLTNNKYGNSSEGYAFAWRKNKFRPVTEPVIWNQYRQDDIIGMTGLFRHPFYGRFTPVNADIASPYCELRLINTHIRFSPRNEWKITEISDTELRRREFMVLAKNVLNKLSNKCYKETTPAYTFLLGDYNMNLPGCGITGSVIDETFVVIEDQYHYKKIITVQRDKTTLSRKMVLNPSTGKTEYIFDGFANNYDHFSYVESYITDRGVYVKADTVNTVMRYCNLDFEKHWREISDHIPILLTLDFKDAPA